MTRSDFLKSSISCCKANLAKPNVRYPNGRMSHDVEAEHLDKLLTEWEDYALDYGLYNVNGRLVAFAEQEEA